MTGVTGVSSFAFSTKSLDGIVAEEPVVGSVTVALPWSSTVTFLPGFAFSTLSLTASFSLSVKCSGSLTSVFAGVTGLTGVTGAVVSVATFGSLASDVFPAGSVAFAVTLPAGISFVGVIVATPFSSALPVPRLFPSLSNNSTVDPGSAFTLTGSLVPALPVRSVSTTGLAGAVVSLVTNSDNGFVSLEPSLYVTTRFPLSSFVTD